MVKHGDSSIKELGFQVSKNWILPSQHRPILNQQKFWSKVVFQARLMAGTMLVGWWLNIEDMNPMDIGM